MAAGCQGSLGVGGGAHHLDDDCIRLEATAATDFLDLTRARTGCQDFIGSHDGFEEAGSCPAGPADERRGQGPVEFGVDADVDAIGCQFGQEDFRTRLDVAKMRVATWMCPSETKDRERVTANITYYPTNYSFAEGTWFVYDPVSGQFGDGAFAPNFRCKPSDISDGTSNTLGASENKAYQPNVWDSLLPAKPSAPVPSNPAELSSLIGSGTYDENGHTEWVEGDVHETGITTTFTPNSKVLVTVNGQLRDMDEVRRLIEVKRMFNRE